MIEVFTIGGYSEVGKNMTAIKIDDEIIILDMGLYLPAVLEYEEGNPRDLTTKELIKIGAIPNDEPLENYRDKVKAIILGHCHLDHIGAAPYLAKHYDNCPIIGTPYTLEVLKTLLQEHEDKFESRLKPLNINSHYEISKDIKIEFINITHSTPQTVLVAIHTKYGMIMYANDFKLDNYPVIGNKPNYERLEHLSEKGIILLIMDSLYSNLDAKTPSEKVAKEMLKDIMLGTKNDNNLMLITTFSSHIARLKSIIEFGEMLNRKVVFLGRSLFNYVTAAEKTGLVNFSEEVEVIGYRSLVKKKLRQIEKDGRGNYLIVCTGNQGEPDAILTRMANKKDIQFEFLPNDIIIFSCRTIPTEMTIKNRENLEKRLKQFHVRIFKDIHVSGHAAREDHRDMIMMLKPRHILPIHGDRSITKGLETLAEELGYVLNKTVHLGTDGKKIEIS
ncbi:MAG: RNase J family beta-CASP ribonuclease [Nanoarchaeota archaeon]